MSAFALSAAVTGVALDSVVAPSMGGTWCVWSAGYAQEFIEAHIPVVAVSPKPMSRPAAGSRHPSGRSR
jgi:hypothetical protein